MNYVNSCVFWTVFNKKQCQPWNGHIQKGISGEFTKCTKRELCGFQNERKMLNIMVKDMYKFKPINYNEKNISALHGIPWENKTIKTTTGNGKYKCTI